MTGDREGGTGGRGWMARRAWKKGRGWMLGVRE